MTFYTYVYRDPSRDNEPIYVGKGQKKRAWKHLERTDMHPFIQRIQLMRKNGVEPLIEIIDALNEDHAYFMEICLIQVIGRKDLARGTLLNLTDGGDGVKGKKLSIEHKCKISAVHKNRPKSAETRAKMSASAKGKNKGRELTTEHKAKISAANKRRVANGPYFSDEARAKMSIANKGKIISAEARAKISAAKTGHKLSEETRAKMSKTRKNKSPEFKTQMSAKMAAGKAKKLVT